MTSGGKEQQDIRVVVEVDGNPVGSVQLDIDRLWPLINHRKWDDPQAEWVDAKRLQAAMRATVVGRLMNRLQSHLYQALGNEIVKAELDIESFALKAEGACQAFGRTRREVENLVAESGRSPEDFYAFFWSYMLDDREGIDPRKEWKTAGKK